MSHGGFGGGTGSDPRADGVNLCTRGDVVVVTMNHRLNIFGWLYLAELGGKSYAASGASGMLDQVQALQWVKDNIAHFGGDPNNVTIWGLAGGARKVSTLLAMPSAKGLFHKAIIESGAEPRIFPRDFGHEMALELLLPFLLDGDTRHLDATGRFAIVHEHRARDRRAAAVVQQPRAAAEAP